ncbi:hypothetical protein MCOR25_005798 [Pyricularia grisea]|uniref:Uncharacterized protein n=1 Tax=Pyricularia grisea TaxID=148305 RepID=A0A6P8BH11_PYRGI|nr:uncharacterized protein PgNI_01598 [Pyricularia grisea]KAI6363732.1 hypothetical protein MCOR25_005798 [Pyricularia grisea]TLD15909.1 hypothetical protein PgNI_01598 [Pyricularia grisea]
MSPVLARAAAIRNAAVTGTRQFSLMAAMRNMARSFEPHPFQRLPNTQKPQAADYAKIFKRSGKTVMIYFPGMALILGWPLMAQKMLDGHV